MIRAAVQCTYRTQISSPASTTLQALVSSSISNPTSVPPFGLHVRYSSRSRRFGTAKQPTSQLSCSQLVVDCLLCSTWLTVPSPWTVRPRFSSSCPKPENRCAGTSSLSTLPQEYSRVQAVIRRIGTPLPTTALVKYQHGTYHCTAPLSSPACFLAEAACHAFLRGVSGLWLRPSNERDSGVRTDDWPQFSRSTTQRLVSLCVG